MADFSYPYLTMTVKASLGPQELTIRQGLRTFKVPLASLRYLFVKHHGSPGAISFDELMLSYEKSRGVNKLIRTFTDAGAPEFQRLVDALVAQRPDIDLRHLEPAEAFKKMGAVDTQKVAFIAVPVLLIAVMGGFTAPWFVHGLDKGQLEVSVDELTSASELASRNLVLSGLLDVEHGLEESVTNRGRTTYSNFFPVVNEAWTPEQPVRVFLKTSRQSDQSAEALADEGRWRCTLRNVLWEGLSSSNRRFFEKEYQFVVADDALLCETGAGHDLMLFGLVNGITVPLVLIICVVVAVRMRRAQPRPRPPPIRPL